MNVFEFNATKLRELHADVHSTYARRHEGKHSRKIRDRKGWTDWHEACERCRNSYDDLAFPGGLERAMALLKKKDNCIIELSVQFLEADPWFYRSGYLKEDIIRVLRQVPLSMDQRMRLQKVIVARIQSPNTPREFRWYCRLAPYVSDSNFETYVATFAGQSDSIQSWHARWVVSQLRASGGLRR